MIKKKKMTESVSVKPTVWHVDIHNSHIHWIVWPKSDHTEDGFILFLFCFYLEIHRFWILKNI